MHKIDLFKGRRIPARSRPKFAAAAAVVVAAPVLAVAVFIGCYLNNRIIIGAQRRGIAKYQNMIDGLSNSERQLSIRKQKKDTSAFLCEVAAAVRQYTQWSPLLVTLAESMPPSVVLAGLEVNSQPVRRRIPRPCEPDRLVDASVPSRTLRVDVVAGGDGRADHQVKLLTDRLRAAPAMKPLLEDIRISQGLDEFMGRRTVSYQIDCILKPGL